MDTLYEEAQIFNLKFFEWPRWIQKRLIEYYHEKRRMYRLTQKLVSMGEMPESVQL